MKKLLGIEVTDEEFDYLICEQPKGKLLKVVDDKVVAVDYVLTEEEIKRNRIAELKALLEDYDYIGTKIATGRGTREEYAEQIAQMTAWADEINELEASL
jgi:hypothetical protein